jgi:hypothetical protein
MRQYNENLFRGFAKSLERVYAGQTQNMVYRRIIYVLAENGLVV